MSGVPESFIERYIKFLSDEVGADEYKWCLEVSVVDNKACYKCVIKSWGTDVVDKLYEMFKEFLKGWKTRGIKVSLRKRNDGIYVKAEVELEDIGLLMDALLSCLPLVQSELGSVQSVQDESSNYV